MKSPHIPVLLSEVKEVFSDIKSGYIIDCTVGYGGHSEALLEQNKNIQLICCDQDDTSIQFSKKRLAPYADRVTFENAKFSTIISKYKTYPIRGILADIGVSSLQLDQEERGFGFQSDNLDMRMNIHNKLSAFEVVNHYTKEELETIFRDYGEVRDFKKAAKIICEYRKTKPIESAKELSSLFRKFPSKKGIHPATLIFQAIRIEVNDELGELGELLGSIEAAKLHDCTVTIISFHSLEDRIVKRVFKEFSKSCICPDGVMKCTCGNDHSLGQILTKRPIVPTDEEIHLNPRSRSSKMRVFQIS
ncbi:16S rRNA (cytosine(1402)-N(4))-methyltransferase RsmH [Sulfurospirillum sp. 1612]|uniref:16S rRNA (cytosine(1402)-N(4))-methyltransferase RsmH n=1 Tax=Sulfurospirillum sp. 1612 TaxID=3094835 RepID=UPI002F942584